MALTMDVFRPTVTANKAGILLMCSGGWFSSHDFADSKAFLAMIEPLTARGYTVFAVVHGSQPRFTIPDAVADIHRAARFIRFSAHDYGIDADRLGITGASSGGHLSLMEGVEPIPGDPKSADPVERVESRVEAVACFFPPTDFLNYGAPGKIAWETNLNWLLAPFDFQKQKKDGQFVLLTGDDKNTVAMQMSPIYFVSAASAPTLIIQGDADILVPYEQAQRFIAKLKAAGVPAQVIIRHGKNHGWPHMEPDFQLIGDWFDHYLLQSPTTKPVNAEP
jgi:acetyl esterase/lipase